MIKNYIKIAWRSLLRHKAYSIINITGLSIGLTACLIVATVVIDELSYDHQWKKADDIYRVLTIGTNIKDDEPQPVAFTGFGPAIKKDLPEVQDYCRMSVRRERLKLGNSPEGVKFQLLDGEASLWNLLDFKITAGNPKKFVKGYVNLIITEKVREQYFKGENPVGKFINSLPDYGKPGKLLITGVVKDIPQNSHLRADVITLAEYRATDNAMPVKGEGYYYCPQYILLRHGTAVTTFTNKANQWYARQAGTKTPESIFRFQPMKDVYLRSDFNAVQDIHGSIRNVYIFSAVAAMLLLIACINFVNLTISRVFNRSKETGIRKVLGAGKLQLMTRFLSESLIFFMISFILAVVLYPPVLKPVETYLGHPLVINMLSSSIILVVIACIFATSLLTGLYPAWFLSRPQPVVILRNKVSSDMKLNILKKSLVVGQFVISIAIIIITFIVHNQLSFMGKKDLGFDKNNLLKISYTNWGNQVNAFKQSVKQLAGVESASVTGWSPSEGAGDMSKEVALPGQKEKVKVFYILGDVDLPATLKLRIRSGRNFNAQLSTDVMNSDSLFSQWSAQTKALVKSQPYLVTNYTAAMFGIRTAHPVPNLDGQPIGIVADFNSESLHTKMQPTFIQALSNMQAGNMLIRVKPGYEKRIIQSVNRIYKSFYPEKPFNYIWVNEQIDDQYKSEYKLQQLFTCFSMLIVFLACLGLFGLISFTVEQRVKEIGIRKVLGAGVSNIVVLISKDYLALIITALIIASPVAWYAMSKWLQDFAYRVSIQWWVFAVTGLLALTIALITISLQSVKAALANPVKSLRSE